MKKTLHYIKVVERKALARPSYKNIQMITQANLPTTLISNLFTCLKSKPKILVDIPGFISQYSLILLD